MQTVFRADDGTIFEKEIDCEKYEDLQQYRVTLEKNISACFTGDANIVGINIITKLVHKGYRNSLLNFILNLKGNDHAN